MSRARKILNEIDQEYTWLGHGEDGPTVKRQTIGSFVKDLKANQSAQKAMHQAAGLPWPPRGNCAECQVEDERCNLQGGLCGDCRNRIDYPLICTGCGDKTNELYDPNKDPHSSFYEDKLTDKQVDGGLCYGCAL